MADQTPVFQYPPPAPGFGVRDVFFGADGLRAGWSMLLYIALVVGLLYGSGVVANRIQHGTWKRPKPAAQSKPPATAPAEAFQLPPKTLFVGEGPGFLCILLATWVMAKVERRPNRVYGLEERGQLAKFFAGLAWGVAMLSLLVGLLRVTGLLIFDARLLFGGAALHYAAVWLAGFLLVGLLEEYLFRGYLQFTLARGLSGIYGLFGARHRDALGFWTAAAAISFGFGFTHKSNAGESPVGLLSAGLIGVVFCLSLWRTGSLWWAIGFHASWDWAQSYLYGVADSGNMVKGHLLATHPVGKVLLSGGATGPEGSLFVVPVIGLICAVVVWTLPPRATRAALRD